MWRWQELVELVVLVRRTIVAYIRMAATVIVAVVVRLCLDCVGLIMTQQDAAANGFWQGGVGQVKCCFAQGSKEEVRKGMRKTCVEVVSVGDRRRFEIALKGGE